jgi:hypothetical protein
MARYELDGSPIPSVTEITGSFFADGVNGLLWWASRLGGEFKERRFEKSESGTFTHSLIEEFLNGRELPQPENLTPQQVQWSHVAWQNFCQWWPKAGFNPSKMATEVRLKSKTYRYGGTFDAMAELPEGNVLLDWKTSSPKADKRNYLMQAAAYRELIRENTGEDIVQARVIRFDKDDLGSVDEYIFSSKQLDAGWDTFALLLSAWHGWQGL